MNQLLQLSLPKKPGDQLRWGQLYGSSLALAVAQASSEYPGLVTVITPDSLSASRLFHELNFFVKNKPILIFPDWEILPYDNFSPHEDIISRRLQALYQLPSLTSGILLLPVSTLMQQVAPKEHVITNSFVLTCGEEFNIESKRQQLEQSGYHSVSQVISHGEYAVRGSLFDVFPMGAELPYRIDLFGSEVDTIRSFDSETQRTINKVDSIQLLPAKEFPLTDEAIALFRRQWREKFAGNPRNCPLYQDISEGIAAAGIEHYLPLFFEKSATLFDYLPQNALLLQLENVFHEAQHFWQEITERHEQRGYDVTRPILKPAEFYIPASEMLGLVNQYANVKINNEKLEDKTCYNNISINPPPVLTLDHKAENPLAKIADFLSSTNHRVLFCAESAGRREALLELLRRIHINPLIVESWRAFLDSDETVVITQAPLDEGFSIDGAGIIVITESQLFGQHVMQRRRRKVSQPEADAIVRDLAELSIGDPVVHIENGIGRYLGLQTLTIENMQAEFLQLEYAGGDKLYVPVSSLHLVSRYIGADSETVAVHRLGSSKWAKAKKKAAEQVRDVAAEILDVYSRRQATKGHAFTLPNEQYTAFAAEFPFEETPDQERAIDHVIKDMTSDTTMDRLICGDVGFGKTEVAMRAAFLAVQDGKQVAILVPTTLLAQQHYQNFSDRFADWAVNIDVVSRFRSKAEQDAIIQKLKTGKIDIIVGTHKLIQKDIKFKNLGLLVIDEEHRFGVSQKEKLKALRAEVDILTLTATPIPRTLNMAMSGMRELSIIATPPEKRLSVKTFLYNKSKHIIREGILREIMRGGQVYYLYNKVDSIERIAQELQELIPEGRIAIGHGQMRERELEKIMVDFYHQRFNILVCTTIIESGIDVPSANTIVIDRADHFGLAQLHQLRGRVGRSHHQAYAYLLIPDENSITTDAKKRLEAITSLDGLGIGFSLASHDLEIRGAGELLGEEQSGQMQAIGFSLYMELLERAVTALKSGKQPELEKPIDETTEIDLHTTTLIPETYIVDVHIRLILYKRIANANDKNALNELQVEMVDRFGLLPEATKVLIQVTELKLHAQELGIKKIDMGDKGGRVDFYDSPKINPDNLIQLIQSNPKVYQFEGIQKIKIKQSFANNLAKIKFINHFLSSISTP